MFPVPVSQFGNMRMGRETLATVFEGRVKILKKRFENRLRWVNQTGHFSLHNLTVADSGSYVIENTEGLKGKYNVKLTVYGKCSFLNYAHSCTYILSNIYASTQIKSSHIR